MTRYLSDWNAKIIDADDEVIGLTSIITDLNAGGLERNFDTTRRAGEVGVIARPQGFSEIEVTFTAKIFEKSFLTAFAKGVSTPITLQCMAAMADDEGDLTPYVFSATGFTGTMPFGNFSDSEVEGEFSMMAYKIEQSMGIDTDTDYFELIYDPRNYNYSVNGTNQLAATKTMLGIGTGI